LNPSKVQCPLGAGKVLYCFNVNIFFCGAEASLYIVGTRRELVFIALLATLPDLLGNIESCSCPNRYTQRM
jgi:hypothetical protein